MTTTQLLAKEGIKGGVILLALLLLTFFLESNFFTLILLCLLCLWIFMFRNPERLAHEQIKNAFLAPCDGRIEDISYQNDEILMTFTIAYLDAGVLRAPFDASKMQFNQINGLKIHFANEETRELLNSHLYCYSDCFEMEVIPEVFQARFYDLKEVYAGRRIGFCKMGRLRLKTKASFVEIKANIGDQVKSGETLLGYVK